MKGWGKHIKQQVINDFEREKVLTRGQEAEVEKWLDCLDTGCFGCLRIMAKIFCFIWP